MAQIPTTTNHPTEGSPRTSDNQLFCCKSIDKLISDSEEPERKLKKTLGPISLTALGIGAVIGSGIFTVIGTAIGGQKFDTSSILNAPLLDFLVTHHASLGRPGAGPALALSLVLVAIVCAFTGLCYAELASMIPIAGSAYTYTYATMGELIAWIIGWDLILEYAVSNMAVSVGFSAHLVGMFDWFGFHPALRWISPAYLPAGLTNLKGDILYPPGLHFGFNFPAFLVVMILTVILVRGIRESAEANNVMVLLKIAAILAFVIVGAHYVNPGNWQPFAPMGWSGILTGGSIIFFTYIGFDSVSTAAEEARNPQRDLPIGIIATLVVCTILYIGVAIVLTGIVPWQAVRDDAAPVVNAMKLLTVRTGSHTLSWIRRDDGNDFVAAGFPAWTSAGLVLDVSRRPAATALRTRSSPLSHPRDGYLDCRLPGWHSGGISGHRHTFRSLEHRHTVRLRACIYWRDHFALPRSRPSPRIPRSGRHCSAGAERILLRSADVRVANSYLAAILRLAGHRLNRLRSLQPPSQRVLQETSSLRLKD